MKGNMDNLEREIKIVSSQKQNKCTDCGKKIDKRSKRCASCSHKGKLHPNYIDGCSLKKYFCKCGKEISWKTAINGKKMCQKCYGICLSNFFKGKNHPAYIDGRKKAKHYCIECNSEISYDNWRKGNKRCNSCAQTKIWAGLQNHYFCSDCKKELKGSTAYLHKKCWGCYIIWRQDPKTHPNYIDGRSFEFYPQEFNDTLRETIRKRDNYECQNCSITEEEHIIVNGRVLDVHHIDYDKKNCSGDNLISLCNSCNVRANYNRNYWKNYYINKIKNERLI